MKKILLASSALVASASFAAADVSISGSAQMGLEYDESLVEETTYNAEVGINVSMSGETDGGLSFGAETNILNTQNGASYDNDDTFVYISGAFGKISMGAVTEADRLIGLGDLGLDGLGTDDVAEAYSGSKFASANTNYTYSNGGLTFAVSAEIGATDTPAAVGVQYDADGFAIALGYADDGTDTSTSVGAKASVGGIALAALYTDSESMNAYGVTATFTAGAAKITAAYSDNDTVTDAAYGVGISYDLGGGASLVGGVADISGTTKADFGVKMSF